MKKYIDKNALVFGIGALLGGAITTMYISPMINKKLNGGIA